MAAPLDIAAIAALRETVRADLWGRVLPFWAAHSVDTLHGGFFNCLDVDGRVTETTKHVWLQGRQCWMFAKLANTYDDAAFAALASAHASVLAPRAPIEGVATPIPVTRAAFIDAAARGVDFLRRHAVVRAPDGGVSSVYFALTREGTPALNQRKPFSAFFLILALAETARATGRAELREEAVALLETVLAWIRAPDGGLGKASLPGAPALEPLNVPMILLNVILELREGLPAAERASFMAAEVSWALSNIDKHCCEERRMTLECVLSDGTFDMATSDGRLSNPGHAIEAGWFVLDAAQVATGTVGEVRALQARALRMIEWAFAGGWDGALGDGATLGAPAAAAAAAGADAAGVSGAGSGGMIYFVDAAGFSPSQLEWPMKLWWPQAECMVAFAKALAVTRDPVYLRQLSVVMEWVYSHLVDKVHGEWWGYADRGGHVTHRFKGGAYKGCFHVPRALFLVDRALSAVLGE